MSETTYTRENGLVVHDVWNTLDEFGLLLGLVPKSEHGLGLHRFPGETNTAFKTRLQQLTSYVISSSKQGLINAISAVLNLTPYTVADTVHYTLRYRPASRDINGDFLSMLVTRDGVQLTQYDESNWDSALSNGYIVWKEYDDDYGVILQLKSATGTNLVVKYWTFIDGERTYVQDQFVVTAAASPTADQLEIHELVSQEFIDLNTEPNGTISSEYYKLLQGLNTLYHRTWGSFQWDNFYFDEGTKLNVIPSYYDQSTFMPSSTYYNNGVGGPDDLKMVGMTQDLQPIIKPGYFYLNGYEYYLFAHKHTQIIDPADYSGSIPDEVALTIKYLSNGGEELESNVHPIYGTPVIVTAAASDILIFGQANNYITFPSDQRIKIFDYGDNVNVARTYHYPIMTQMVKQVTGSTSGHTHTWTFYNNIVDAAAHNGVTDETNDHFHEIIAGVVQSAGGHTHSISIPSNYGYYEPTGITLRKRTEAPTSTDIPDDENYFTLRSDVDATYVTVEPDRSSVHRIEFELSPGDYIAADAGNPVLDSNLYNLNRTFIAFAEAGNLATVTAFGSVSSVRTGGIIGISVIATDSNKSRVHDAEVVVTAPSGTVLNEIIGISGYGASTQRVVLGHTYSDGTLYGRVKIASSNVGSGSAITLTVSVSKDDITEQTTLEVIYE